jgi:predicted HicB family RNase H-like nuclease
MPQSTYSMRILWSDEDQMFVATCPELGDLSALSATYAGAAKQLQAAIALAVESYELDGRAVPPPVRTDSFSGQFRLRIPKSLHAWLAAEADREGVSLNSCVAGILSQARGAMDRPGKTAGLTRGPGAAKSPQVADGPALARRTRRRAKP